LPFEGGSNEQEVMDRIKNKSLHFPGTTQHKVAVTPNINRTELIKGLLDRNIPTRLGSSNNGLGFETDIKTHPFLKDIDWDLLLQRKMEPKVKPNVYSVDSG
jgi:hypothetical protein